MTPASRLRVGLIGANGRWGPSAHAPALQRLPETELYAVCTAHADTAQAAADKYGVKHAYSDVKAMGANTTEPEELAPPARKLKGRTMVGLQRRASPAYLHLRELVRDGYVWQVLSVNMAMMNSGVLTRTADRTWQRDVTLGANTLTITFGHAMDALCMVGGELTEVSAVVSTQVPQWFETDTKKYVDVTSPDNIMLTGRLEGGAVVSASVCVQPYHGSGYRLEIYGKDGTLMMIGGGEAGQEAKRKIVGGHKDDKALQELPVPERLKWVPEEVRNGGPPYARGHGGGQV